MLDVNLVNNITLAVNRYAPVPILFFGFIGNILNVFVFTRRSLIKNPCAIYFLSSTIVNFNVLLFGSVIRSLADGFSIDLISISIPMCRLRYYILHTSMVLSSWFTVLASIDRYCVSCRDQRHRQWSNRKNAYRLVFLTTMIFSMMYCHVLALFTIEQVGSKPNCYAKSGGYRIFYDFFYFATFSFTPPILMIIIGMATFRNIHYISARINPNVTSSSTGVQMKRRDRQLTRMLLLQLVTIVICTLPIAIQKLYSTFTQNQSKDAYRLAVENLVSQITRQLLFLNSAISFYVYTLSGSVYREELIQLINKILQRIFGGRCQFKLRSTNTTCLIENKTLNQVENTATENYTITGKTIK